MSGWLHKLTQLFSGAADAAPHQPPSAPAGSLPNLLQPFAALARPDPLTSQQLIQNLNGLLAALCPPGAFSRAVRIRVGEAICEHLKVKHHLLAEAGDELIDFAMAPEQGSLQIEGREPVSGTRRSLTVTTGDLRQAIPKLIRDKLPDRKPEPLPLREGIELADAGFQRFAARNPARALRWLDALAGMDRPAGLPVDQWRALATAPVPASIRPPLESFEPEMRSVLSALLEQIDRAPGDHRLGSPASDEVLADWEAEAGSAIPGDLRALYRFANGMWLFRNEWVIRPLDLRDLATAPVMEVRDPEGVINRDADGAWHFYPARQRRKQSGPIALTLAALIGYLLSRVIQETSVFMGVELP